MPNIELDTGQGRMLREILESYLGDLRMEVAATDRLDFREMLKEKERFIKDLMTRLSPPE